MADENDIIESLGVKISSDATGTLSNIDKLINKLGSLKQSTQQTSFDKFIKEFKKLDEGAKQIAVFADKMKAIQSTADIFAKLGNVKISRTLPNNLSKLNDEISRFDFQEIKSFGNGIESVSNKIKNVSKISGLASVASGLRKIKNEISDFSVIGMQDFSSNVSAFVDGVKPLESVSALTGFADVVKNLNKIPKIAEKLNEADLQRFAEQMERLHVAMSPLANDMDSIARGFDKLPEKVQKIIGEYDRLERKSKTTTVSTKELASSVKSLFSDIRSIWNGINRISNIANEWFMESANYSEALNLFNVTMKDGADYALEYANNVRDVLSIDVKEWLNYQGEFENLVEGYDVAVDRARIMSKNLTQLSYDLSSVFNVDVEKAFQKLQSGMSGQVKSLKVWGVDVSVSTMKQYLLAKGIDATWTSLNNAQKAQLRYNYIMEKTVSLQGDLARTIETPANAMRVLNVQITQLKRELGNIVSIFFAKAIPYIQAFVEECAIAARELADLWGFELPEIDYSGLDSTAVTEEIEETTEAVKELKREIMSFDEIHKLGSPQQKTGFGAGLADDLGLETYDYDFLRNSVRISAEIRDNVRDFVAKLKEGVKNVVENKGTLLTIIAGISSLKLIKEGAGILSGLGDLLKIIPGISGGSSLGVGLGGILGVTGWGTAYDGATKLTKALSCNAADEGLGWAIGELIGGVAGGVAGGAIVGGPIGALIGGLGALGLAALGAYTESNKLRLEFVSNTFWKSRPEGLSIAWLKEDLESTFGGMADIAKDVNQTNNAIDRLKSKLSEDINLIQPLIDDLDTQKPDFKDKCNEIIGLAEGIADGIKEKFALEKGNVFAGLVDMAKSAGLAVSNEFQNSFSAIQSDIVLLGAKVNGTADKYSREISSIIAVAQNGGGIDKEALGSATNNLARIAGASVSDEEYEFEKVLDNAKNGLNVSTAANAFSQINDVIKAAYDYKDNITAVHDSTDKSFANFERQAFVLLDMGEISKSEYQGFVDSFNSGKKWNNAYREAEYGQWQGKLNDYAGLVKTAVLANLEDMYNASVNQYNKFGFVERLFAGSQDKYVRNNLMTSYDSYVKPIEDKLNELLGYNYTKLSEEAMKYIDNKTIPIAEPSRPEIPQYAEGGFPEDGFFYANHGELVGQFSNGKTAVANNQQIVEGIKQGVAEAIRENGSGSGGDWVIQIVDQNGNVKSETTVTEAQRRNKRSGKTVIPLGV